MVESRVARHLRTLGILWIGFAAFYVLRWLLIWPLLHTFLGDRAMWMHDGFLWTNGAHPGSTWLLHVIVIAVAVRTILSLAVGFALLTRQPWGRIFAIVIAVLTLIKPLVGTLLAIYTLWVLFSRNADQEYNRLALSKELRPL
jgi:hypothetical protein